MRILDSLFTFVGVLEPDGTVFEANRAPLVAAGLAPADVIGRKFWDTYWWSYSEPAQAELRSACARAAAGETVRYDAIARMAGDTRMAIDLQIAPLIEDGRLTKLIASAVDITDRKRGEDEIRESEARFREMADHLPQMMIWVHDETGALELVNERYCEFFGVSRDEMKGGRWQVLLHPDDAERYTSEFRTCFDARRPFHAEARARRIDGQWRWVESWAHPRITPSGTFHGYIGASADITERKAAEQALLDADRRKDEYLAVLGHELRNPLASIRSASELLKALKPDDARLGRVAEALDRQSAQMTRLVDGLLDVSRIHRGKIELHRETLDLRSIIDTTLQDYLPDARARGLKLHTELPGEPAWVSADRVRLHQILGNLLGNAIKFTPPEGRITVELHLEPGDVHVRVRDTGIGIGREMLARIFEPFCQESQEFARTSGGLGLGLALVRGLVELHGGTVAATSEGRDRGAELVVRLPRTQAPAAVEAAPAAAPLPARRILVVEDNDDAALMLQTVLELQGHEVDVAYTGEEALRRLGARPFDVVLCDLGLPGMTGYDVARAIRADPRHAGTLLVALTGYGQDEALRQTRLAGFDIHQTKPVDVEALGALLERQRERAPSPTNHAHVG